MTIVVTDDTTRLDLATAIALVNADAKRHSRRGRIGTTGADYARLHAIVDELVAEWLERDW